MEKVELERNIVSSENDAKISFENYAVNKIILRDLEENEESEKEKGNFEINVGIDENKERIKINMKVLPKDRYVEIEMIGIFKFSENFPEEDKEKFLRINGAAILYPYIRAYTSTVTSFDKTGNALIIPTINFQRLYEDSLKQKS